MQARLLCWRSDSLASASQMTDNNRQQAMIPEGSTLIPNPVGTAPGFIVETDDGAIIAVPGVPREMMRLMQDTVLPYLRARPGYDGVIRRRVLRTVGIGESALDDMLGALMLQGNPTVGLAAKTAQVDIRIAARSDSAESAEAMIEEIAEEVRGQAGAFIYSETAGEDLETVVVDLLAAAWRDVCCSRDKYVGPAGAADTQAGRWAGCDAGRVCGRGGGPALAGFRRCGRQGAGLDQGERAGRR